MATIAQIRRSVDGARKVSEFRILTEDALAAVNRTLDRDPRLPTELKRSAKQLRSIRSFLARLPATSSLATEALKNTRNQIMRAWINVAGANGELTASRSVSLWKELKDSAKKAPGLVGKAVGSATEEAGFGIGRAVFGLFRGLGPILSIIIGIIVWKKYGKKIKKVLT